MIIKGVWSGYLIGVSDRDFKITRLHCVFPLRRLQDAGYVHRTRITDIFLEKAEGYVI